MRFFISHSNHQQEEVDLAAFLAGALGDAGHEAFLDTGMLVGTDWVAEIDARLKWCDFFVVLLSASSVTSEMVQGEVRLAHSRFEREGAPRILPIRVRLSGRLEYELDCFLGRLQYTRWEGAADSPRLLAAVLAAANGDGGGPAELPPLPASPPAAIDPRRPRPAVDPRIHSAPGGTLKIDNAFYIQREADEEVLRRAQLVGETLVIKAPRQMGKSSLLLRYLAACQQASKHTALFDFSLLSQAELDDYGNLLSDLGAFLLEAVGGGGTAPRLIRQRELTTFVERLLDSIEPANVTLAFDEVDRVMGSAYQSDFFALLRHWHNKRAEYRSPWFRLDLALVISTEPYLLIARADQSPFNVSPPVELAPFSRAQCGELNERYGRPLEYEQIGRIHSMLGGHPYLTQLAFYCLVARRGLDFSTLMARAATGADPFSDHLHALLLKLDRWPGLLPSLRQILARGIAADREACARLKRAGVVVELDGKLTPASLLYAQFFNRAL